MECSSTANCWGQRRTSHALPMKVLSSPCRSPLTDTAEMSVADMVRDLQKRCGRSSSLDVSKFERKHQRVMGRLIAQHLQMIPGISQALDAIACRICVASSGAKGRIRSTLKKAGLFERFHPHIFSASVVARGKPFPDLFLHAAAQMRVDPRRCVVVEDSMPGVTAAVAANMRVIGFAGGSHCRAGHSSRLHAAGRGLRHRPYVGIVAGACGCGKR